MNDSFLNNVSAIILQKKEFGERRHRMSGDNMLYCMVIVIFIFDLLKGHSFINYGVFRS